MFSSLSRHVIFPVGLDGIPPLPQSKDHLEYVVEDRPFPAMQNIRRSDCAIAAPVSARFVPEFRFLPNTATDR